MLGGRRWGSLEMPGPAFKAASSHEEDAAAADGIKRWCYPRPRSWRWRAKLVGIAVDSVMNEEEFVGGVQDVIECP